MYQRTSQLLFCIFVIISLQLHSQDQNYSQFFNNGLYYNPSYAGLYDGVRTYFNYRNQWTNLPYDFKSYNAAVDISARDLPGAGGLGLIFHNNNEGEGMLKNLYAGLLIATRIETRNLSIQFGITTAFCQRNMDWDRLVFPDQLNGKYGNIYTTNFSEPDKSKVIYPDFNFGSILNYYSEKINARIGGAFHHIFEPNIGFTGVEAKLPMKFIAHGDIMFIINENSRSKRSRIDAKLNPGIFFENQHGANTFSIGVNGYKSSIYLGIWYRNEDINTSNISSMIFLTGVNLSFNEDSRVKLMYSYDYVMNKLIATGGTHELSLILEFNNANVFGVSSGNKNVRGRGRFPCTTF